MSSANALRVHSRVRVASVTILDGDSPSLRRHLLKQLGATGAVIDLDPRWRRPWRIELDDGTLLFLTEHNLEVLGV